MEGGSRIRDLNEAPVRPEREVVLYWMTSARRTRYSPALERALHWCRELGRPLVVLEALRLDHPWASERFHSFIIQGMADNARRLKRKGVVYHPYVEGRQGEGRGLVAALGAHASVVVTDDFPTFFLPSMTRAAGRRLDVRLEAVDGNGILPMRAAGRAYGRAVDFRRHMQRSLADALRQMPLEDPLKHRRLEALGGLPGDIARRWPATDAGLLARPARLISDLSVDHRVEPVAGVQGGQRAGRRRLEEFLEEGLDRYHTHRNHPDAEAESGLSPYLHFGHVSAHEVLWAVAQRENWSPQQIPQRARGARRGWWSMNEGAEAFLDQLLVWREMGYRAAALEEDHGTYGSLPDWARETLEKHSEDPRPSLYTLEQLEQAQTDDPLWNAAQRQLRVQGRIQNYLRMLWGKRILEWTPHPRAALEVMTALNDRWALDGRDPNSRSGILWVLGKYDRPWAPERPIFGRVRYMTSRSAMRKLRLKRYLARWGEHVE